MLDKVNLEANQPSGRTLIRVTYRDHVMTARVAWYDGTRHVSVLGLEAIDDPTN